MQGACGFCCGGTVTARVRVSMERDLRGGWPTFHELLEPTTLRLPHPSTALRAGSFAVFEGWEARTATSPRHADFEFRLLLLVH
jgi:dienelactone hydrolase